MNLKEVIRDVPNFPIEGIIFKDITPLLSSADAFNQALEEFCKLCENKGITKVIGIESRGFIFGGAIANKLGVGFVPVRKPGKLPYKTQKQTYELEYGTDSIEIHEDALVKNDKVLLHDDLLATGGTMNAAVKLVESLGAEVIQISFLIELSFLKGREQLKGYDVHALMEYTGE